MNYLYNFRILIFIISNCLHIYTYINILTGNVLYTIVKYWMIVDKRWNIKLNILCTNVPIN